MESESAQQPLKVCPNCSVASRTDADICPSCGKPYVRPPMRWRWWFAIPIIVLAFGVGYGGRLLIQGDSESDSGTITTQQARAVKPGDSRAELDSALDGADPAVTKQPKGGSQTCVYYSIEEKPDSVWQFCLVKDKVVTTNAVGG